MALLFPLRRPGFLFGLVTASSLLTLHPSSPLAIQQKPLRLDTFGNSPSNRTPLLQSGPGSKGGLNPTAVRQISLGSVLGLASGLAISTFSKPLTIIFGILIVGVQFIESRLGINVLPRDRIQRWFKGLDVKSAVEGKVPFKIAFAGALILAGWGSFSE